MQAYLHPLQPGVLKGREGYNRHGEHEQLHLDTATDYIEDTQPAHIGGPIHPAPRQRRITTHTWQNPVGAGAVRILGQDSDRIRALLLAQGVTAYMTSLWGGPNGDYGFPLPQSGPPMEVRGTNQLWIDVPAGQTGTVFVLVERWVED